MVVKYENIQLARTYSCVGTNVTWVVFDLPMAGEEGMSAKLGDSWDTKRVN
jgi:hypothetical protein